MKKKLLCTLLLGCVILAGCSKHETAGDTKVSENGETVTYAYHDDSIDLAEYKGLETAAYQDTVTPDRVDDYINGMLSYQYGTVEEGEQMYTVDDLTDDIATELSGKEVTVEQYREEVETMLKEEDKVYYETQVPQELFERIVTLSTAKKFDDEKLAEYKEYLDNFYQQYASDFGMEWETFRKDSIGCETDEDYDAYLEQEAKDNVKREMVIETICKEEKIEITDEDKDALLERFVDMGYAEDKDGVRSLLSDEELETNTKYYKVMDLIMENAKVS